MSISAIVTTGWVAKIIPTVNSQQIVWNLLFCTFKYIGVRFLLNHAPTRAHRQIVSSRWRHPTNREVTNMSCLPIDKPRKTETASKSSLIEHGGCNNKATTKSLTYRTPTCNWISVWHRLNLCLFLRCLCATQIVAAELLRP